jgi:hypothetical protein
MVAMAQEAVAMVVMEAVEVPSKEVPNNRPGPPLAYNTAVQLNALWDSNRSTDLAQENPEPLNNKPTCLRHPENPAWQWCQSTTCVCMQ